ncbi:hypothetical protein FB45DRAFT_761555 [Roridomyces roridus]|uniref:Uncharacterized protein n=1 Tax=Roridomyces roridus TaxID=1738132 RepID=A0AAD7B472_9AGAR|nr:hypothetical protein FB45DRAFT_761555 [Roridomyces roridus]
MAPTPPQELTVAALTSAKGAQLKFWIIKANEAAEKKVLNTSGTVEHLRSRLASYYDLDLTVIPREDAVTAPSLDQSIRDRQWADFVVLGKEWKAANEAGRPFTLCNTGNGKSATANLLAADGLISMISEADPLPDVSKEVSFTAPAQLVVSPPTHPIPVMATAAPPSSARCVDNTHSFSAGTVPSVSPRPLQAVPATIPETGQHASALLEDLSTVIAGLERRDGLDQIIDQVESGAVAKIRALYGPKDGQPKSAHKSWGSFKNIVSKRERLHRILTEDFGGDKSLFFSYFTAPPTADKPPARKKIKTDDDLKSKYRPYRKIVEARPWCEADLVVEREKGQYRTVTGEFSTELWVARWGSKNSWEVWREIARECYNKKDI